MSYTLFANELLTNTAASLHRHDVDALCNLPRDEASFREHLREMVQRHSAYVVAKQRDTLGASKGALRRLEHTTGQCESVCALCLENMDENLDMEIVTLPCGHSFHSGHEKSNNKRSGKRKKCDGCKGVLHWLETHTSCPQCRSELPSELPAPSQSEAILLPLLHRQTKLVNRQSKLLKDQQQQIHHLKLLLEQQEHNMNLFNQQLGNMDTSASLSRINSFRSEPDAKRQKMSSQVPEISFTASGHNVRLPALSWQSSICQMQQYTRKQVLAQVTMIALKDIVVKGSMDATQKQAKLFDLAGKVELILYCCAPGFQHYADMNTLKQRTLDTVKALAEKARALKQSGVNGTLAVDFPHTAPQF